MKNRTYWDKAFTIPLEPGKLELRENLKIKKGKLKEFSIVLRARLGRRWRDVVRYDNAHNQKPHCHRFVRRGREYVEFLGEEYPENLGNVVRSITLHIRKHCHEMIENYKYSK